MEREVRAYETIRVFYTLAPSLVDMWLGQPSLQSAMKPRECMGRYERHTKNSGTQGNCVAGLSEVESSNFANQKVPEYEIEKAPQNIDQRRR